MSITSEFKQYSETAAEQGKQALAEARKSFYAVVGAYDAAFENMIKELRKTEGLPRTAAKTAKSSPAELRQKLEDYLTEATSQALSTYTELSKRGEDLVHEFRKDPRVQRVIIGAEKAVDTVEDSLKDLLDGVSGTVKSDVAKTAEATRGTVRKAAARNTNAAKANTGKAPVRKAPATKVSKAASTVDAAPSSTA